MFASIHVIVSYVGTSSSNSCDSRYNRAILRFASKTERFLFSSNILYHMEPQQSVPQPLIARNNFVENINLKIEQALIDGPPLKVDGQQWALTIVLGPEGCAQRNVKYVQVLLGVFDTEQECDDHASKLWKLGYQWFDIHKMPMYKCMPFPPCTKREKVIYCEKEMRDIMGGYAKQEQYAQRAIQERVENDRIAERERIKQLEAEAKTSEVTGVDQCSERA